MTKLIMNNKEFRNVSMAAEAVAQNKAMFIEAINTNFESQIKTISEAIRAHFKMLPKSFKNGKKLTAVAYNTINQTGICGFKKEVFVDFQYSDSENYTETTLAKLHKITFLTKEEKAEIKVFQKAVAPFVKMMESLNLFLEVDYEIKITSKKSSISSKIKKSKQYYTM